MSHKKAKEAKKMGFRVNTNVEAINAQRNLGAASISFAKSVEKLSSGLRINRAGDDAAGLSISEKLRAQVKGLTQAVRNAQDGISMIQTAEGALTETHSILQRVRELAVQAGNDTLSTEDRESVGEELLALKSEIDRIADTTKFNGKVLLNGSLATDLDATSEVVVGLNLAAGATDVQVAVSALSVAGAAADTTYTLSSAAAGELTLTATVNGNVVAQTVDVSSMVAAAGTQVLNWSTLGVSITLVGGNDADSTAANIITGLTAAASDTVVTAAGSGSATLLIGAESGQTMAVAFTKIKSDNLGTGVGNYLSDKITDNTAVDTTAKAQTLLTIVDEAIGQVSTQRAKLGAYQNRLEHTAANLSVASENLAASESRVRDVDMASEMVNFTKSQILQSVGTAILAQANQSPQAVLQLLR